MSDSYSEVLERVSSGRRPWGDTKRSNRMIFIGRNLDREELMSGFNSCMAA